MHGLADWVRDTVHGQPEGLPFLVRVPSQGPAGGRSRWGTGWASGGPLCEWERRVLADGWRAWWREEEGCWAAERCGGSRVGGGECERALCIGLRRCDGGWGRGDTVLG